MHVFKQLKSRKYREIFLFLVLAGLIVFSSSNKLTVVYGITFSFTSIFLFLMFRIFGMRMAIFFGIASLFFVPESFTSIGYGCLSIIEVLFVGAFFFKGRKAKMFYVDALFWVSVGIAGLLFLNWSSLSGNALYFQVSKDMINGSFNVLLADMLLAYFPFYRMCRVNKNNVSFHQFLSHITFISILVPFFLNIATNAWNVHDFTIENAENLARNSVNRVEKDIVLWNKDDIHKLYDPVQISHLNETVMKNKEQEYDLIITDNRQHVVASSTDRIKADQIYDLQRNFYLNEISDHLYEALPKGHSGVLPIIQWGGGYYVYMENIDDLSMKILIQFPILQYQEKIYRNFIDQLKYSMLFAVCIVVLVQVVSRIFMNNLKQLIIATTGLPQKIHHFEQIKWPQSYVSELRLLTLNLRKMADKIRELFRESHDMNEKLTEQTVKLKESEDRLHQLAFFDVLTGLPNRLHFQAHVRNEIKSNPTGKIAVIFIDINQFKQINDTLGHDAGDALLQLVGTKLGRLQNDSIEIFRLSGDEFVVVQNVSDKGLQNTIKQILHTFSHPFPIMGHMFYVSASVGVSMYPEDGEDLDTLVKCADIAMYISKENGGNKVQFFNETMRNKFQERLMIENALRNVVDNGGFELYYQPKTCLDEVTSMEALLRWKDPKLGFVSPATFIPIAEEIGLIFQIDEWSLIEACKQNQRWQEEGLLKVPISVNISAIHFQQDSLIPLVKKALEISGMEPKYLKLEITESVFIKNPIQVAEVIYKLKKLGVLISIDDFGTGYSSMYQLLQLPFDEVKIDRQFVIDIHQDEKKALLVKSILDIAHGLQLNVVAEGVETTTERDLLMKMGCDEIQGYLFSPPVNKEAMRKFLAAKGEEFALSE
ncbi:EAL domain-containing protein [Bacillus sp. FJAT-49736]|uniref:putative bifunctional diguanylate cyclase/phosphodiesterase n=1 Tax=Bacillus sp. FJAT-49736 TaxID=2833582 RepID=UPI001BCA2BC3|nr:EAL domain-containing protein [Bacillus sp. FJAT-49736]MBS4175588.1 EAL domain-containing protein [Bacillus sp. FJAT-49736]